MPSRQIRSEGRCTIDLPSKRISPASGLLWPAISENNVVLPAPFAPIKPQISPALTSRLTSRTAATPPKRLDTLRSSSSGTSGSCATSSEPALDAARQDQHENDQHGAENDHIDLRRIRPQQLREQAEEHHAEQRSFVIVAATDQGHGDDGDGHHRIEHLRGF